MANHLSCHQDFSCASLKQDYIKSRTLHAILQGWDWPWACFYVKFQCKKRLILAEKVSLSQIQGFLEYDYLCLYDWFSWRPWMTFYKKNIFVKTQTQKQLSILREEREESRKIMLSEWYYALWGMQLKVKSVDLPSHHRHQTNTYYN